MDSKKRIANAMDYVAGQLSDTPLQRIDSLKNLYNALYGYLVPTGKTWVDVEDSQIKLDVSDDIGRKIYHDEHETEIKDVLPDVIDEGDIIIDVGGHYGYYTAKFNALVGESGKIIVVEPHEKNVGFLKETIERNGWENVQLVQKAISNSNGKINLNSIENGEGRSFIDNAYGRDGLSDRVEATFEVDAIQLSSLIREYNLESIDLIKIDIEGAELKAIKSLIGEFNSVSAMIVEIHSHQSTETYRELYNILSSYGNLTYIGSSESVNPSSLSTTSANLLWQHEDS